MFTAMLHTLEIGSRMTDLSGEQEFATLDEKYDLQKEKVDRISEPIYVKQHLPKWVIAVIGFTAAVAIALFSFFGYLGISYVKDTNQKIESQASQINAFRKSAD